MRNAELSKTGLAELVEALPFFFFRAVGRREGFDKLSQAGL
jgi:hypothetical protein